MTDCPYCTSKLDHTYGRRSRIFGTSFEWDFCIANRSFRFTRAFYQDCHNTAPSWHYAVTFLWLKIWVAIDAGEIA